MRDGTARAPRSCVASIRLALAVTVAAGIGQTQPSCPSLSFQGAASASLKPSASTHTVVLQQSDRSYTAFELTDASPYRIVRTTRNFQKQFAGCPGLPVTGTQPVNQPPEVFTPLRFGGYLWARIITGSSGSPLDFHLNVAVFNSTLTLTSEAQYPVANVGALAVADVNGDELPDILIGASAFHNPSNATVQVLIGNGGSSFQPAASYVISNSVFLYSILVADLNGDHKPDLVISSSLPGISGKISVFLGNGDGTFQAESTAFSGITLFPSVAIADLNGDGKPDLAFTLLFLQATNVAPVAEVALGAGDGTFGAPMQYPIGGTDAIAIGDLNGDGFPDIVTSGFSILFGDGSGGFPNRADYWQAVTGRIILADFDGDGKPDIIVGSGNSAAIAGPAISVLFARGRGTFGGPPVSLPNGVPASLAPMVAADFNGDGFPDLVGLKIGGQVGVLAGVGDGTFRETFHYAPGNGALVTLAAGDFNGDGKLDIIAALIDAPVGHLQVLLGRGDGTFQPPIATTTPFGPSAIAVADFNGDGRLDVAFLAADSTVLIFLGSGTGAFAAPLAFPAGPSPTVMAVGDFNRDGKLDLIVGSYLAGDNFRILFGTGDGAFLAPASIPAITNSGATGMVAADLNRDGLLDVAVTTSDERILVLLGRGDGSFRSPAAYSAIGFGRPYAADLNGDGIPDLISGNFANWLLGNGDGSFQPEVRFAGGYALGPIVAADFNHDGRLDLAGSAATGVATLLNISQPEPLTVVSAASFAVGPLAPDSLATAFGSGLASNTAVSVGGISAAVLYASAGQVNFLVPASLAPGPATVTTASSAGSASVPVSIAAVAPAVFTLNSAGLAAAYVVRVRQGSQAVESISEPIDLGLPEDQVYLILFGTGIRGAAAGQVSVQIQGINAPVIYAGPQSQFSGLDQVNVQLPRELTGTGDASVVLTADGTDASTVHISVK